MILGVIAYIIVIIKMIIDLKNKNYDKVEKFIICSGVIGLLFTLIVGIAYNEVATAYSIKVLYLCGAYPLMTIFSTISIINCISCFAKKDTEATEIVED